MAQTSGSFSETSWLRRKHDKLPFFNFKSSVDSVFEIIHSDIWTTPIPSESRIKYYAIFLDHFSHFVWVYPLHKKSDLFDNFVAFRAYVNKQFNVDIKALQYDHDGEYDNTRFHDFFRQNGMQFQFSYPRTSQQNGKSELGQFTHGNDVSVEFDAYGFSVKDYQIGRLLLHYDSTGDLYPVTQQPSSQTPVVLLSFSSTTWHKRLGHLGDDVLHRKHDKLSFFKSESSVDSVFEIIHSDI
ncbi:ribonuclease H-like domain-containing protein [Tanacetum coccineum]|uniref:Ribonuclease H-like domain-containing protein n=1 Tax=Tanacetum coccineum TaxID=301880 RepID=A0ABQ4Z6E9_9ASTR